MLRSRTTWLAADGMTSICCAVLCLPVSCGSRPADDNQLFDLAARAGESLNLREEAIRGLGRRGRQDLLLGLLRRYGAEDELLISDAIGELRGSGDEGVYTVLLELHDRIAREGQFVHGETNAQVLDAIQRFKVAP